MPSNKKRKASVGSRPRKAARSRKRSAARKSAGGLSLMLVDDHPMWRDTVRKLLEGKKVGRVVAEASDGTEVVPTAKKAKPDVVIMDMALPTLDGAEATRQVVELLPDVKVLVLSASSEKSDVLAAVRAGARGYLLKTSAPREVVEVVRRVSKGELVLPPELSEIVLAELREGSGEAVRERHRVVLGDPSMLSREGVARLLEDAGFEVLGSTGRPDELLGLVEEEHPDVVVLDARLLHRETGEIHTVEAIREAHPDLAILVMSEEADVSSAVDLLSGGAKGLGFVLKERLEDVEELAETISRVAAGESIVDPEVVGRLVAPREERNPLDELTQREREVLGLMAEGLTNQAICDRLFLTRRTVEAHVRNIFMKLGLEPTADDHRRVMAVLTHLRSV